MIHRYSQDSIVFMFFFLPEDFKTNVAFSGSGKSTNFNCNDIFLETGFTWSRHFDFSFYKKGLDITPTDL